MACEVTSRVGIVVVSHSASLASDAVDLAMQMVQADPPAIRCAAGLSDGGFGTDATAIADAIASVDGGAGVAVVTDLGSAVMNAQVACELVPGVRVRLLAAPFVEGLVVAVVEAASGSSLEELASQAEEAMEAKCEQLASDTTPSVGHQAPAST
jgi:dihydroxyacetone kinase phosphotransfer subunit